MDYSKLRNTKILVTGATGLIGKALICRLIKVEKIHVVAFVRNLEKAKYVFREVEQKRLSYIVGDITSFCFHSISNDFDYIIHAASETSSKAFVQDPIGVSMVSVIGTRNLLEFASRCNLKKMVFLSSMEVYGTPTEEDKIDENAPSNINTMDTRSSYPESKRMCESLCHSYYSQIGLPTVVLRLTQTFGTGVLYDDPRVFAEFARSAIEGHDIVLKTKGETKRPYLHLEDAVESIIFAIIHGVDGEAYNVANEDTYCSIYEMAMFVAHEIAGERIGVRIEESSIEDYGYAPTLKMNLSTEKISRLGWKPRYDLRKMYLDMITFMKDNK